MRKTWFCVWLLIICLLQCGCNSTKKNLLPTEEMISQEQISETVLSEPTEASIELIDITWKYIEEDCPVAVRDCLAFRMGNGKICIRLEYYAPAGLTMRIQDTKTGLLVVGEGSQLTAEGENKVSFELEEALFENMRSFEIIFGDADTNWTLEVSCGSPEHSQSAETPVSYPVDFQKYTEYTKQIVTEEEEITYSVSNGIVHFTVRFTTDMPGCLCGAIAGDLFNWPLSETVAGKNCYEFDVPLESFKEFTHGRWINFNVFVNNQACVTFIFAPHIMTESGTVLCEAVSLPIEKIADEAKTVSVEQECVTIQPMSNGMLLYRISFETNGDYKAHIFDWPNGEVVSQPRHCTDNGLNEYELILPVDIAKEIQQLSFSIVLSEERYHADRIFLVINNHSDMIQNRLWAQEYAEQFTVDVVYE